MTGDFRWIAIVPSRYLTDFEARLKPKQNFLKSETQKTPIKFDGLNPPRTFFFFDPGVHVLPETDVVKSGQKSPKFFKMSLS